MASLASWRQPQGGMDSELGCQQRACQCQPGDWGECSQAHLEPDSSSPWPRGPTAPVRERLASCQLWELRLHGVCLVY